MKKKPTIKNSNKIVTKLMIDSRFKLRGIRPSFFCELTKKNCSKFKVKKYSKISRKRY